MKQSIPSVSPGSMLVSVVLPVAILYLCSGRGGAWYQLGATSALVLALSLPVLAGLWALVRGGARQGVRMPLLGIGAALLTGLVTVYVQSGEGEALRPSMPWVYAAKEVLVPMLAVLVLVFGGGAREGGLFCSALGFLLRSAGEPELQPAALEARVDALNCRQEYRSMLRRSYLCLIGFFVLLALVKFGVTLWFQFPVLELPVADQLEGYNHAIGSITLCCTVVNMPLMVAVTWLGLRFLKNLRRLLRGC